MIEIATGAKIQAKELNFNKYFAITEFGAAPEADAVTNTQAIQQAIDEASRCQGGTVVVPAGVYRIYTLEMKSYVNLFLEKGSVLQAARCDAKHLHDVQIGEGGSYKEPEVEKMVGLQDHGHSYLANSLVYAEGVHHFMISGAGTFSGAEIGQNTGYYEYILWGDDPKEPIHRREHGHQGEWFGNKGIALKHCSHVVLKDFSFVIGGHFAVITEGVEDMLIDGILLDTNRDALDLDSCRQVTVRNSVFNSLTDDALVIKSSFGAGEFFRTEDILVEDCKVCGYDAGSVAAGTYEAEKLVAADRCGPTGRVKLGTESSCGYDRVTIRRVHFDRCRGFAIEAVDCSDATNILLEDCTMEHISSSPIYLRAGDRGRFPVTGNSTDDVIYHTGDVRLDQTHWILPDTEDYENYPIKRYSPSYAKTQKVSVDGNAVFTIVDSEHPTRINEANLIRRDGKLFVGEKEIAEKDAPLYANANGGERTANIAHVHIKNLVAKDVDPRYPILIMGLMDSRIEDITFENVHVTYRGGLSMKHAVEQKQLNTWWKYEQFHAVPKVQNLPWLVNTFFLKSEGLLPRVDYDPIAGAYVDDPYNVPELPDSYPEPSNWGILPCYGMYVRHASNLTMKGMVLETEVKDERDGMVFDDVDGINLEAVSVEGNVTMVTNHFKRPTNLEYVKEYPYQTTTVKNVKISESDTLLTKEVTVNAPAPGTPKDSLYSYETVAIPENGYQFAVNTKEEKLPLTVFRPFFKKVQPVKVRKGETVEVEVGYRIPALEALTEEEAKSFIEENQYQVNPTVSGTKCCVKVGVEDAPSDCWYDEEKQILHYCAKNSAKECEKVVLSIDDGIRKEYGEFVFEVVAE